MSGGKFLLSREEHERWAREDLGVAGFLVWLKGSARWRDGSLVTQAGHRIDVPRGTFPTSRRQIADRLCISRGRVDRYLMRLVGFELIDIRMVDELTLVRVLGYAAEQTIDPKQG